VTVFKDDVLAYAGSNTDTILDDIVLLLTLALLRMPVILLVLGAARLAAELLIVDLRGVSLTSTLSGPKAALTSSFDLQ
jgi:hypothetical protein